MDLAMKLVQEHCGRYMKVYANCVERFPDTWHLDCEVQRVKLAACADGKYAKSLFSFFFFLNNTWGVGIQKFCNILAM